MSINVNIEKTMGDFCLKTKFDADIGITAIFGSSGAWEIDTGKSYSGAYETKKWSYKNI
jgi:ABC-type molybdate transport system ATPase subunit